MTNEVLQRRLARERAARKQAEHVAEEKTRALYLANEELRQLSENLEQLVDERTADLAQARDAALAASRAKSEFLANMSHEVRTPLNAVLGLAELLLDTPLDAVQHDYVHTIHSSGNSLLTILNDILDFSKIESGNLTLEDRAFDFRHCVETVVHLLTPKASEKGLLLSCNIHDQLPTYVMGDEVRMRQVLLNLVSNAIKFTERGEVAIDVRSRTVESGSKPSLVYEHNIRVRDTGVGIPKDKIEHLFESFSQVDASITRQYGGTGLGLAISRRLVELMGGTIGVESEGLPGRGSTFHVTFRTQAAPAGQGAQRGQPEQQGTPHSKAHPSQVQGTTSTPPERATSSLRILVAEDNRVNQKVVRLMLGVLGYQADIVESGLDAVEAVRDTPYDVILMDVQLPGMDGVTATQQIRSLLPADQQPVIVAMTANAIVGDRERFLEGGMDDYISKPFRREQLAERLAHYGALKA